MGHHLIIVEGGVAAANSSSRVKSSGFRRACYGINAADHRDFGYREHSLKARPAMGFSPHLTKTRPVSFPCPVRHHGEIVSPCDVARDRQARGVARSQPASAAAA
jgi:hypothetical protein